jgi:hypothetical protein
MLTWGALLSAPLFFAYLAVNTELLFSDCNLFPFFVRIHE